jgi:hypothetical protein
MMIGQQLQVDNNKVMTAMQKQEKRKNAKEN